MIETYCARHPKVETGLACGRCDTPICPRCAVMTDVGARCPACAPSRRLPQFEITPLYALRGLGAALAAGGLLGAAWAFIVPPGVSGIGFFGLLLALGLGYAMAEAISVATNRKSGPPLQVIAVLGIAISYVVRNLVAGEAVIPGDDTVGYIFLLIAAAVAFARLRY